MSATSRVTEFWRRSRAAANIGHATEEAVTYPSAVVGGIRLRKSEYGWTLEMVDGSARLVLGRDLDSFRPFFGPEVLVLLDWATARTR